MSGMVLNNELKEQWQKVLGSLHTSLGDSVFKNWFDKTSLGQLDSIKGNVKIFVPTRFIKDWLERHYSAPLTKIWNAINPQIKSLSFEVRACLFADDKSSEITANEQNLNVQQKINAVAQIKEKQPELPLMSANAYSSSAASAYIADDLQAPLDTTLTFDTFVKGKANEFALLAAKKVAEQKSISFSPLFLTSAVGLGKTHLMQAIANQIKSSLDGRKVLYLSAERFMYKFIESLKNGQAVAFKEFLRSLDVLLIDDIQFLAGKDATQTEFFHTFNALMDSGKQIVLSADTSPANIKGFDLKLKNRFAAGLEVNITPADYDLRIGILNMKASLKGVVLNPEVSAYIASSFSGNARELEGALNRLLANAELLGEPITLALAERVLKDVVSYDKPVSIEDIQNKVAGFFNIKLSDLHSVRKQKEIALPRQIAMYLSKELTTRSLPDIARRFDRDHATVMHAVKKIQNLMVSDDELKHSISLIKQQITG